MHSPRVVVLGGGVGGTCAANRIARKAPAADVHVVDAHGDHQYQPGFVRIPFGARVDRLVRSERTLLDRRVRLTVARVSAVDPDQRELRLESGEAIPYDWLVLSPGCKVDFQDFPGGKEGTHHFHCRRAAAHLKTALDSFRGERIVVGAAGLPYKCPPSVPEFAFLLDEWLRKMRRRNQVSLTYVYPAAGVLPFESVARRIRPLLENRGYLIIPGFENPVVDPGRRTLTAGGKVIDFDLAIMAPRHSGMPFVRSLASGPQGWIHVDRATMKATDRIYVVGDAADLPCPKNGAAAHLQAIVAADNVVAEIKGRAPETTYDGSVLCFLETGRHRAAMVTSAYNQPPDIGAPNRWNWIRKSLFSRFYFRLIRA